MANVNLISTKDGERVLITDPRDKNMERARTTKENTVHEDVMAMSIPEKR